MQPWILGDGMFRHTRYIRRLVLGRFLLVTNTVSACVLDSLGDALEQRGVEHVRPHDWPRTLRMGTVGLLLAPVDHYWYRFLDSRFPGTRAAVITKKITLDILILAPLSVVLFYIRKPPHSIPLHMLCILLMIYPVMCKLEGKRWKEAVAETKQKFATTYEVLHHPKSLSLSHLC